MYLKLKLFSFQQQMYTFIDKKFEMNLRVQ